MYVAGRVGGLCWAPFWRVASQIPLQNICGICGTPPKLPGRLRSDSRADGLRGWGFLLAVLLGQIKIYA